MPVIHREGPYRFYFLSLDRGEPPHVHVGRDRALAKFWLSPVQLQSAGSFSRRGNQTNTEDSGAEPDCISGGMEWPLQQLMYRYRAPSLLT